MGKDFARRIRDGFITLVVFRFSVLGFLIFHMRGDYKEGWDIYCPTVKVRIY